MTKDRFHINTSIILKKYFIVTIVFFTTIKSHRSACQSRVIVELLMQQNPPGELQYWRPSLEGATIALRGSPRWGPEKQTWPFLLPPAIPKDHPPGAPGRQRRQESENDDSANRKWSFPLRGIPAPVHNLIFSVSLWTHERLGPSLFPWNANSPASGFPLLQSHCPLASTIFFHLGNRPP